MATLYGDTVWEGQSTETKPNIGTGGLNGHFFKELDTGESYILVDGTWEYINLGLAFIKATKSGNIVTDSNGDYQVTFNTPFINNQYSIQLTVTADPGGGPGHLAYVTYRNTTGFIIKTRNAVGVKAPNVPVSYLCTRDYDP